MGIVREWSSRNGIQNDVSDKDLIKYYVLQTDQFKIKKYPEKFWVSCFSDYNFGVSLSHEDLVEGRGSQYHFQ